MRNKRDFVPRLCISTCSRLIKLRSAYQTAFGLYPLLFYKESALFFGFYSGFTRGEYHVIRVDFIVALRRTKGRGRRTLRSPPSPSSGLHLIHPGGIRRSGHLRGQERCWRGIGDRKSPVSFQPPPRGADKIYRSDVVFPIGETNTNNQSQTQFPYIRPREEQIKSTEAMRYSSLAKPIETPPKHRRFL